MDIQREPGTANKQRRRRLYAGAGALAALALIWLLFTSLEPAARSVDTGTLWVGTVERGDLVREVRGPGILVPEETRWLAARTEARVEEIRIRPGTDVEPEDVILVLSNPAVERAARDAEWQLQAARADFQDLRTRLASDLLSLQANAAAVEADLSEAQLQVEANQILARDGLIPKIELRRSEIRLAQLENLHRIEQERLKGNSDSVEALLGSGRARLGQAEALHDLRRGEREALEVRAPVAGVLQSVPVEVGEQVSAGTNLARVVQPDVLKAELRIAEVQARDLQVGQRSRIDTRNGIVAGRIARIAPAAQGGTVTVEVRLEDELPLGARPQQSVDGTIELERLEDVLRLGRPVRASDHATLGLFKLSENGKEAHRVQVELGRSSVDKVEVITGLTEGDRVILSDMTQHASDDRLRLK